MRIDEELSY